MSSERILRSCRTLYLEQVQKSRCLVRYPHVRKAFVLFFGRHAHIKQPCACGRVFVIILSLMWEEILSSNSPTFLSWRLRHSRGFRTKKVRYVISGAKAKEILGICDVEHPQDVSKNSAEAQNSQVAGGFSQAKK